MRILVGSLRGLSGIETYAVSLAHGLSSAGHDVVILDETGNFRPDDPRIEVVGLSSPRHLPWQLAPLAEWGLIGEVRRIAREHAIDVIHTTRLGLAPRNVPLVITAWDPIASPVGRFRAGQLRGEPRVPEAMYAVVDGVAARRAGAIVAVTPAVQKGLARNGRICELIPAFIPDEAIGAARPSRPNDIVMVAGKLDLERKDLNLALEAVARVRETVADARLVLVGGWLDSNRPDSLPDFCEAHGLLASEDVRATLGAAGCCLVPSLWEEFGYAGLEALAAGAPVVSAPLPAYEGLSGGGVFMAETRDPARLAEQIAAALAATSFEFPAECRSSVAVPRILDLYERAFASKS